MPALPRLTLILGGARSGKSRLAEAMALSDGRPPVYIATAQAFDAEMGRRIAQHRLDRHPRFGLVEAPHALADAIRTAAAPDKVVLVDCLTVWLGNLFHLADDIDRASLDLLAALADANGPVILVSNEVGLGIVPENALARAFRDAQGRLNQAVAAAANRVVFVAAGLPLIIKG